MMAEWIDNITLSFEKHFKIYCLIIALVAGFNLFFHLGLDSIKDWDEARNGITAYEMVQNHDYIKMTYMGETEYCNLKPPLGMWLISLAYKIFGFNAFALRFFSSLSAFFLILLAVYFARKFFDPTTAILSGFILATSFGVLFDHAGRAGEFDSKLALLVILCVISLYKMKTDTRYFYLNSLCISLAFLLKSFASFQLIAITVVYLFFSRKIIKIKFRDYLLFFIMLIIPISLWAIMRYNSDGTIFFQKMLSYDLLQRGMTVLDGHQHDVFFYIYTMMANTFPWILLLFIIPFSKHRYFMGEKKRFLQWMEWDCFWQDPLIIVWFCVPLLMFSLSQTKLPWYIKPQYPALGIFIGWLLASVIKPSFPKKKFFTILMLNFLVISEALMIGVMIFREHEVGLDQQILTQLNTGSLQKNIAIYAVNWSTSAHQGQIFIAEVEKGLKTCSIANNKAFIRKAKTNDLLLMPKNSANQAFVKQYSLRMIDENREWLLAQK
jgi:4-amino-4-deoxy-L-arabinose transferase-like glycosyltransferase